MRLTEALEPTEVCISTLDRLLNEGNDRVFGTVLAPRWIEMVVGEVGCCTRNVRCSIVFIVERLELLTLPNFFADALSGTPEALLCQNPIVELISKKSVE